MEKDDELSKIMGKILDDFAKNYAMPISDLCNQFVAEGNRRERHETESVGWGTLPEDYDPTKDESHPMHGFNSITSDDSV
jgi:hypothetical protein